jgi:hypothetical protein
MTLKPAKESNVELNDDARFMIQVRVLRIRPSRPTETVTVWAAETKTYEAQSVAENLAREAMVVLTQRQTP